MYGSLLGDISLVCSKTPLTVNMAYDLCIRCAHLAHSSFLWEGPSMKTAALCVALSLAVGGSALAGRKERLRPPSCFPDGKAKVRRQGSDIHPNSASASIMSQWASISEPQ